MLMLPMAIASAAGKKPISEKKMSAYLMVFHRDDTHSLYMALSRDGYHFTALNNTRPVISGDTIAEQRGVRDPHIYIAVLTVLSILQPPTFISSRNARVSVQRNGNVTEPHTDGATIVDLC